MSLEMMGFRILIPNFGGDIYVFGSIIGVFLAALSLGYYAGGRVADRFPTLALLGALIVAAGLFAVAIPTLREPFLIPAREWIPDPRWGACAYTLLLFGPSTFLLGMVSPFAIRLSARRVGEVGRVSGRLYALSTFGSIFGTLFTSFYWIAWWPISRIVTTTGWTLCGLGAAMLAVAALGRDRKPARLSGLALLARLAPLSLPLLPAPALAADRVLYEKESLYHRIVVTENARWRTLKFNRSAQSGQAVKDPLRSEFAYTDAFHLAFVYQPNIKRVLFIGAGAATGPKQFRSFYPEVSVEVVEIDPEVIEVAKRYFSFAPDSRTTVHVADGRLFLNRAQGTYDAIIIDAYYADAIPFHLTTVEFVRLVNRRLAPGGVAIFNMIGGMEGRASRLVRSQYKTIREVFPTCGVFPVLEEGETPRTYPRERIRNVMLVATQGAALSAAEIARRAARLKNARLPFLGSIAAAFHPGTLTTRDVPLLTDDFAPVNHLIPVQ